MAAISKTLSQAGKSTAQIAQQVARNALQEKDKIVESVATQTGLPVSEKGLNQEHGAVPEVVQQIRETGAENIDREALKVSEQSTIARLEGELKAMTQKREQASVVYNQQVEEQMKTPVASTEPEAAPQGKIRKAVGKAKKAVTNLLQGRKQQESKQGTGKG